MNANIFAKGAAFTSFVVLMTGFVAYKGGIFDRYLKKEFRASARFSSMQLASADTPRTETADTFFSRKPKYKVQRILLPSSKSGALTELVDEEEFRKLDLNHYVIIDTIYPAPKSLIMVDQEEMLKSDSNQITNPAPK